MRYQWSEDLATGNQQIDSEHKTLIKAADELVLAISSGQGQAELDKALYFLTDYTKKHFGNEETLQDKTKYPDVINHKSWHKNFINDLAMSVAEFTTKGASSLLVIDLNKKVSNLINHIRTEDKKLATHIKAQS